jgi:hypothetical protein
MICQHERRRMVVSGFVNADMMMLVMVQSWLAGVDMQCHGGVRLLNNDMVIFVMGDTCDG